MFKEYDKKSSLDVVRGRYNKGGKTEKFPKRLGWWDRTLDTTRQIDDVTFIITNDVEFREDMISAAVYGRDDLGWLILQYNNIVDINEELKTNTILYMPSPKRALSDITI